MNNLRPPSAPRPHTLVPYTTSCRSARGINVSVSGPSSTLLDATARKLPELVRASVHYYNNEAEIDACAEAVAISARSEEHTSELQSLMRISYAVFCLKNKKH